MARLHIEREGAGPGMTTARPAEAGRAVRYDGSRGRQQRPHRAGSSVRQGVICSNASARFRTCSRASVLTWNVCCACGDRFATVTPVTTPSTTATSPASAGSPPERATASGRSATPPVGLPSTGRSRSWAPPPRPSSTQALCDPSPGGGLAHRRRRLSASWTCLLPVNGSGPGSPWKPGPDLHFRW